MELAIDLAIMVLGLLLVLSWVWTSPIERVLCRLSKHFGLDADFPRRMAEGWRFMGALALIRAVVELQTGLCLRLVSLSSPTLANLLTTYPAILLAYALLRGDVIPWALHAVLGRGRAAKTQGLVLAGRCAAAALGVTVVALVQMHHW